jgi:uncharacterized protein YbaR (Trm112 family)
MSLDKRLLDILCCPTTKQPVAMATASQIELLNRAISSRALLRADGSYVTETVAAALVTRDGRSVYRIDDGIPVMLADLAIGVSQLEGFAT